MPEFRITANINARVHGCIIVAADSAAEARAMITEDETFDMAEHFTPDGFNAEAEGVELNHARPGIYVNSVEGEDEAEIGLEEDWPTKEEREETQRHEAALAALRAIRARVDGVWDHPDLKAFGPLHSDPMKDIMAIAHTALCKLEKPS